jgi:hypothetical protein
MNKFYIPVLCLLLLNSAFAQGIYKWTDETGKVHYGDRVGVPQTGTKTAIKGSEPPPESSNLQTCLGMARVMADKKNSSPSEVRADSKNLLNLCPGTAYECVTYLERPESNNCKAMALIGPILKNQTFRR